MAYMEWDSGLETGVNVIDSQHQQIVEYINRLYAAINLRDRDGILVVLEEVVNYTSSHFSFEEEMMKVAGYPYYAAHCQVHRSFEQRVQGYRERVERGEDIAKQLLSDLRIWLTNHIKNDDRDYTDTVLLHFHGRNDTGWLSKTIGRLFRN